MGTWGWHAGLRLGVDVHVEGAAPDGVARRRHQGGRHGRQQMIPGRQAANATQIFTSLVPKNYHASQGCRALWNVIPKFDVVHFT